MPTNKHIVKVTAYAANPKTGKLICESRTEEINIKTNIVFKGCKTLLDVKEVYEFFWNRLPVKLSELVVVTGLEWKK